jgi:hypothetical protein
MIMASYETIYRIRSLHAIYDLIRDNGTISYLCVLKFTDVHSVRSSVHIRQLRCACCFIVSASSSFNFDGKTIAFYDATFMPLHNRQDELRLRFKTNYPHGLLFYAKGTQNNDYMSVELRNGSIFVSVDLGRYQLVNIFWFVKQIIKSYH